MIGVNTRVLPSWNRLGTTCLGAVRSFGKYSSRTPKHLQPLILPEHLSGIEIAADSLYNKGSGFPSRERDRFNLRGLLPPVVCSMEIQLERLYIGYHRVGQTAPVDVAAGRKENVVAKYLYLTQLQDRNETLFYRLLVDHIKEMAPIIYTPTIGIACQKAGAIFRRARGLYFSGHDDVGDMHAIVRNWPHPEVDVVVVTDGSRILGLGDLGAHGMAIPIGKLSLYVAGAGIDPQKTLPVMVDVGTNNEKLLNDPLYLGVRKRRLCNDAYVAVIDEMMDAIHSRFPKAMIQFEDFANPHADMLLDRYRRKFCMFNDDIQGTGTMCLAGMLAALRVKGKRFQLQNTKVVCLGGGSAGIGVCRSLAEGMREEGLSKSEAAQNFYVVDVNGLIASSRGSQLTDGQTQFARHDLPNNMPLLEVIKAVKPDVLLGLSGAGGTFTPEVLQAMAACQDKPIIFAMSNPTVKSECTAQEAYDNTGGRAIFATGSPFADVVDANGKLLMPASQANNMFIFPGLGLGATSVRAKGISRSMLFAAAKQLALQITPDDIAAGRVFPSINKIREVSLNIAIAVAEQACKENLHKYNYDPDEFKDWADYIEYNMWEPLYRPLVNGHIY